MVKGLVWHFMKLLCAKLFWLCCIHYAHWSYVEEWLSVTMLRMQIIYNNLEMNKVLFGVSSFFTTLINYWAANSLILIFVCILYFFLYILWKTCLSILNYANKKVVDMYSKGKTSNIASWEVQDLIKFCFRWYNLKSQIWHVFNLVYEL